MSDEAKKNQVGRPTAYDPEMCEWVVRYMAEGYSKEASAALMNISTAMFYRYVNDYPEFREAVKIGEGHSRVFWEKHGISGLYSEVFSASTWIFNMKNRFGWKDKHEMSTDPENPMQHEVKLKVDPVGFEELQAAFDKKAQGGA